MAGQGAKLLLSLSLSLCASSAHAADEYLYVVNATGKPIHLLIDANPSPPLRHLIGAALRVAPGTHVLAATVGDGVGHAETVELKVEGAVIDGRKRFFWCYLVGQQADGAVKIISVDRPTCTKLIERGVGDRPPS